VSTIEFFALLERLEALVNSGQRVPFVNKIMLDEQECLDIIAQMRMSLPEELKTARRMLADKDRIPEQARLEAERIIQMAKEQAEDVLSEHGIVRAAEERAQRMIHEAERRVDQLEREADRYVLKVLTELRSRIEQLHEKVQGAIDAMNGSPQESEASEEARRNPEEDSR